MAPCRGLYPFADRMFRPRKKSTPRPPQSIPHQPRSPPPIRHTRSPQSGHQAAGRTEPRLRPHPPATPTVGIGNDGDFTCHTRSRPTPATPATPHPPRPQSVERAPAPRPRTEAGFSFHPFALEDGAGKISRRPLDSAAGMGIIPLPVIGKNTLNTAVVELGGLITRRANRRAFTVLYDCGNVPALLRRIISTINRGASNEIRNLWPLRNSAREQRRDN